MNGELLVSVIVPAYNVERYIETCIDSILKQDYVNVEVIAVDDGATDKTPQILNKIALQEKQVKVIHKKNEGVSAARNTGLEAANGTYIIFIDGDDYIATDCVSYMVGLIESANADFAFSKKCFTMKEESQTSKCTVDIVTPEEATAILISPDVIVGCWNKIYKKSFLDENNIRFRTDLYYGEGLNFITTVAQRASTVVVGNKKVYFYRRNNEQSATAVFNIQKIYNGEKSIDIIENNLIVHSDRVNAMLMLHRSNFYIGAVVKIVEHKKKKDFQNEYRQWLKYVRCHWVTLAKRKDVSAYRKLLLLCGCVSPQCLAKLDLARRKKIVENSVVG